MTGVQTCALPIFYAIQDLEDDALAGVKSSARRLGARAPRAILGFYGVSLALAFGAYVWADLGFLFVPVFAVYAVHLILQATRVQVGNPVRALVLFKANSWAGLVLAVAFAAGAVRL